MNTCSPSQLVVALCWESIQPLVAGWYVVYQSTPNWRHRGIFYVLWHLAELVEQRSVDLMKSPLNKLRNTVVSEQLRWVAKNCLHASSPVDVVCETSFSIIISSSNQISESWKLHHWSHRGLGLTSLAQELMLSILTGRASLQILYSASCRRLIWCVPTYSWLKTFWYVLCIRTHCWIGEATPSRLGVVTTQQIPNSRRLSVCC